MVSVPSLEDHSLSGLPAVVLSNQNQSFIGLEATQVRFTILSFHPHSKVLNLVTIPKPPRALSAVGDWGAAIFQQIDQSLEESRPSTARAPIPKPNEQTPPPHSRDLSNASSNYSTTQDSVTEVPTRQPSHRIVVGSPVLHEACSPHPRPTSTVIATDPHFKGSRRDTRTSQHTLSTRAHSILLAELLDTYVQSQNARALAKKKKPETERRKAPTPPQRRDEHKAEPFIIPSEIM